MKSLHSLTVLGGTMKVKRTLTTLAATLLAVGVGTTAYSPAASAASSVVCTPDGNGWTIYWLDCTSSNGANTIWYINGVHKTEGDFDARYHGRVRLIGVLYEAVESWFQPSIAIAYRRR